MTETISLAQTLINIPSITPRDMGCQKIIQDRLQQMGFRIIELNSNGVNNFLAIHGNDDAFCFGFSGHTDVVPSGNEHEWTSPPFQACIRDEKLFGRGSADMKSALAAMVIAAERFLKKHQNHRGKIAFLVTSDEEGDATDGTKKIVDYLQTHKMKLDYCLVGEASSNEQLGDAIKVGRRGSLHGRLTVFGKQGHIAYPQLAENPIHRSFQALDALTRTQWDNGNELFSPTSFQIYNINADPGASNIIPGTLTARFNFRYAPTSTAESLQKMTEKVFRDHGLNVDIRWQHASNPFYSEPKKLRRTCIEAIETICGITTKPNTTGGTSDGRFIAALGTEIVELGVCNSTIHQIDEHTAVADIENLTKLYELILEKIFL